MVLKGEMVKTWTESLPETVKPCLRFIPVATGLVCVPRDLVLWCSSDAACKSQPACSHLKPKDVGF